MSSTCDEHIDYLIVDDEKLIHSLVIRMLRSSGFRNFCSAYDANEALRIMRQQKVGFLITDLIMPLMTGIELIRVIRADPNLFATPSIILTGICSAESVLYAMEEGADGYLIKPFTADKLVNAINSIRQRRADGMQSEIVEMTRLKLHGDYSGAIKIAKDILKKKKDYNVLFMLGECLTKIKQHPAAVTVLTESAHGEKCGKSNNLIGKIYMEQGEHEKGIEHLKLASEQSSLNLGKMVDLAQAYFKSDRISEAEAVVDTILKSNPTNLILADVGNLYLEQGDIEKAGSFLDKNVLPTQETIHTFNTYGIYLRRIMQYEKSEAIYRKCLQLITDSFALYFNAGMVYIKMKNYPQAEIMLEHVIRLNPDYEPAKIYLETVRSKAHH